MGLDLFFFERAKNAPDESQYARGGYFRKVNPFLKWVDKHVGLEVVLKRPTIRQSLFTRRPEIRY